MALGSSAPEIILNILEAVQGLGECPGKLGPSTIVGSAAFNLLVISGASIVAVTPENDNNPDRDTDLPKGVKKVNDMGVFTITASSSVFAYVWLFIVLYDQIVTPVEAYLTLVFFGILIVVSYCADRHNSRKNEEQESLNEQGKPVIQFDAVTIYRQLLLEKKGDAK